VKKSGKSREGRIGKDMRGQDQVKKRGKERGRGGGETKRGGRKRNGTLLLDF